MKQKGVNIFLYTALKLLLALCALWLMQACFHVCNMRIFHVEGFGAWVKLLWGNVVFGLSTVAIFFAPFTLLMLIPLKVRWKRWYRVMAELLYILPMIALLAARGSNSAYYQYTYRLLSDEIFSYLGISGQMGSLVPLFARDYWYAWVLPLLIFVIWLIASSRVKLAERSKYFSHTANDLVGLAFGVLVMWFAARGGFGHFLQPSDAARYAEPKNTALVNNDAYNIFRTLFTDELSEVDYMSAEQASSLYPTIHKPLYSRKMEVADSNGTTVAQRNVVLIIVESLGQEFMGCYNTQVDADTRTPFLDSLAEHCTVYNGRSNGKKSIEGITAITTSIPNLMSQPFTNSKYGTDDYIGLPTVLKRHGYHCAFFHGSYNGVMNFDSTCFKLGFDEYHGKNEYEQEGRGKQSDYDGAWGIFDEPFLQYTVRQLAKNNEPFLAEIFTTTSHHPFPIPEEHKGEYVEGRHPILKCVEYTDFALRRFFEEAEKQPWFANTLFIITGDHSGHGLTPDYNDYDGWYRIPMLVFDPASPQHQRSERIVQQIDLFPTIVDWLGFEDSFVCFGQSIMQSPTTGRQFYYGNGYHVMVSNSTDDPSRHEVTTIMGRRSTGSLENVAILKAVIQQYNQRILHNDLTIR